MNHGSQKIVQQPSQHAYVMTGTKTLFLCHLPMLHMEEHMYQIVLRVRLPSYAMREYVEARKAHPDVPFFLGNVAEDLLTVPDLQTRARCSFIGSVWQGIPAKSYYCYWPWRDQKPIIANAWVDIERVIYFRHFDFNTPYPESQTYVLFGSGEEAHLYHYQTRQPDFDQVLSLKEAPAWLSPAILEAGVHINFPDLPSIPKGNVVYCSSPLNDSTTYSVQYSGQPKPTYEITIDRSLWFSTKITNYPDPCGGAADPCKGQGVDSFWLQVSPTER